MKNLNPAVIRPLLAAVLLVPLAAFAAPSITPDGVMPEKDPAPKTAGGACRIQIDTSETPDLTEFVNQQLLPVMQQWYPKLVALLPSAGFEAPREFSIVFKQDMPGVADTSGTHIRVAAAWFRANLKGEAVGAVVHEMIHVVQQYGNQQPKPPHAIPAPGWLTEGLADYIRFYLFEPQTRGAEIPQNARASVQYHNSYRITANFLNYVTLKYDKNLVPKLNAAIRGGNYNEELWKNLTGHTLEDLGTEWKQALSR